MPAKTNQFNPAIKDGIQYNVRLPGDKSTHDMIHINEWLESVWCGGFTDYDGYGDLLTEDLKFIKGNAGRTRPSKAMKEGVPSEAKWISWVNK